MTDDDLPVELHPDDALADPAFDELFTALREVGRRPAPAVQPALAALLTAGVAPRRRRGARGATVGLAVVGVLAGGVGAAAATGHLEVRPPAVTRVADRTTPAPVTAEPGDHPVDLGVPSPAATAHGAPEAGDPDDLDLRTDAGPPTGSDASGDGDSAASDEASSHDGDADDDGDDGDDEAQVPASADVDDDHSGEGGGHSGKGGGGGDGSSGSGDVTSEDGADRAG